MTTKGNILKGSIKNRLLPVVQGVGFIVVGEHTSSSKFFSIWNSMLKRCYSSPTCLGTEVVTEWHDFQKFAEWASLTYVEGYELAKDLTGGTVYGPETCNWLPHRLNNTINTSGKKKESNLPAGVTKNTSVANKFRVYCTDKNGVKQHLGHFTCQDEAFLVYKKFKKQVLRELADDYYCRGMIDDKVKNLLYNFKIIDKRNKSE